MFNSLEPYLNLIASKKQKGKALPPKSTSKKPMPLPEKSTSKKVMRAASKQPKHNTSSSSDEDDTIQDRERWSSTSSSLSLGIGRMDDADQLGIESMDEVEPEVFYPSVSPPVTSTTVVERDEVSNSEEPQASCSRDLGIYIKQLPSRKHLDKEHDEQSATSMASDILGKSIKNITFDIRKAYNSSGGSKSFEVTGKVRIVRRGKANDRASLFKLLETDDRWSPVLV